jgi:ABC-type transport system involved in Fe-S cluster assembly fused permease/ATPase subunit
MPKLRHSFIFTLIIITDCHFNDLYYEYYSLVFVLLYFTFTVQHTTSCIAQTNAPEDGQNCCPKYVELIWIHQ